MSKILNRIISDRKGYYVHAIEVDGELELETIICDFISCCGLESYTKGEYVDFFSTMSIYYIGDCEEQESRVNTFDVVGFINELDID